MEHNNKIKPSLEGVLYKNVYELDGRDGDRGSILAKPVDNFRELPHLSKVCVHASLDRAR